ncbi:MAG: chromate transporter [Syntrophobacteraceae bacterium]|nr:chromate transporter [Syntrophobacteraceae bacterium]
MSGKISHKDKAQGLLPANDVTPTTREIVWTWLKIGTIGFGGGYAVLDLIHSELVIKHGWLTEQRFENMTALSEMAPGALTVNLLAGIAYRLGGLWAMIAATIALILPSFLLIVVLAGAFLAWQNNLVVRYAMEGLTAGVVGLLIAVVWDMVKRIPGHWCCFTVGIAALFLGLVFPVNPVWLVLMGGLAGATKVLVLALVAKKSAKGGPNL